MFLPGQNNTLLQQSYKRVLYGTNLYGTFQLQFIPLGAFTDNTPCVPGLILALITAGGNADLWINWKTGGANGQANAGLILVGQYNSTASNQTGNWTYGLLQGSVYDSGLVATTGSDFHDALVTLQAVQYFSAANEIVYQIRGPAYAP